MKTVLRLDGGQRRAQEDPVVGRAQRVDRAHPDVVRRVDEEAGHRGEGVGRQRGARQGREARQRGGLHQVGGPRPVVAPRSGAGGPVDRYRGSEGRREDLGPGLRHRRERQSIGRDRGRLRGLDTPLVARLGAEGVLRVRGQVLERDDGAGVVELVLVVRGGPAADGVEPPLIRHGRQHVAGGRHEGSGGPGVVGGVVFRDRTGPGPADEVDFSPHGRHPRGPVAGRRRRPEAPGADRGVEDAGRAVASEDVELPLRPRRQRLKVRPALEPGQRGPAVGHRVVALDRRARHVTAGRGAARRVNAAVQGGRAEQEPSEISALAARVGGRVVALCWLKGPL